MGADAPRAPKGLGAAGRALWRAVVPKYVLSPLEVFTLEQAARLADVIAALDRAVVEQGPMATGSKGQPVPHPAIAAAGGARRELARLIRDLDLPGEPVAPPSPRRSQQSRAGASRWAAERRRSSGGGGRGEVG